MHDLAGFAEICSMEINELRDNVQKRRLETVGGWRRKGKKSRYVKQGDLYGTEREFMMRKRRKSPPCRSQSTHSSEEIW